ncbi:arsenic-transport integral membrane protein ArsB1 [Mycobacterium tuberculosis]|nr:arsenic-transport integral membrane protein ArsB1 [Mycobacterium tuberculosis]
MLSLNEREAIHDRGLLIKCGVVLVLVFAAFIAHPVLHIQPSLVALLGAGVLVRFSGLERSDYLSSVEWDTLLFFAGLFVMVGALVKTGVVEQLARAATELTGGNELLTVGLILGISAPVSGIIDNIPYVATMTPIVTELVAAMPGHVHPDTFWWALALSWKFTRKGAVVTAVSLVLSAVYLWLR